ncbi:hypothetical protein FIBSPDRAFT_27019 [Athelia psychrophila]|uniref:Mid2 domain-containing protein n=1 Tax=Athelia psychrophila TaxID=1759441 RepID=A0A166G5C6_9AGAM|nr:hypothetical protein FIBSPDRAFT_27019 [Fibularhizoctonia sp. CBS 109695]
MRTTFSTALVFTLVVATANAIDLGRRQGSPLSVASSTTTSSATPPTVSSPGPVQQGLIFSTPTNVTTCQPADIAWSYIGSAGDLLTLAITNEDVNQTNIAVGIDPGPDLYTWSPVNLPAGYYVVLGTIGASSNVRSDVFLISGGSDTSCIATSTSSSSSATSTSATSTIAPSSTSSITPVPVPVSSAKKSNTGAIAGGVVAGIIALLILIFIGMMLMRRRNKSARASRFSNSGDAYSRATPTNGARHHGPSESTGGMLISDTGHDIGPAIATAVEAHSNEDLYSVSEKDMSGSPGKSSIDAALAHLSYTGGNNHRSSSSSTLNHQPLTARTSLSHSRGSPPDGRRPSLDIADYARSERSSSAPGAPRPFSPRTVAATSEFIPMGRSSSGASRRASRKPVPQYDASELQATPSEQSLPSPLHIGAESGLRHQSSSGDVRPVHYLIPDMPPPGQY